MKINKSISTDWNPKKNNIVKTGFNPLTVTGNAVISTLPSKATNVEVWNLLSLDPDIWI